MTADQAKGEVARLRDLGPSALRVRWRTVMGKPAPKAVSGPLLLRALAYRVQADALGDLSPATVRLLDGIAGGGPVPLPERRESLGTVLVREWNGVRHHLMVLKAGYGWNGGTYRSLSEVAFAITGTKWSGPRFFGLKGRPPSKDDRTSR